MGHVRITWYHVGCHVGSHVGWQRIPKEKLIFIDGTIMKAGARPTHGLAPKGKKAKMKTTKATAYQPRVDMWGAISYQSPSLSMSKPRRIARKKELKDIEKSILNSF